MPKIQILILHKIHCQMEYVQYSDVHIHGVFKWVAAWMNEDRGGNPINMAINFINYKFDII